MKVRVSYTAQLRHALNRASEVVEVSPPVTVEHLIHQLSELHGKPFDRLVLSAAGELNQAILISVGTECVGRDLSRKLIDGDELILLCPVSGG